MTAKTAKTLLVFITSLFFLSASHTATIFVNAAATGAENGTSWPNAYLDLQDALAASQYGDEVWVAAGIYYPTPTTDRNISFEIPNGVKLYGGFSGNETSLVQRDWLLNETILSGDIGAMGDAADNSYNVVYLSDVDLNTAVDGVTIRDGNADKNSAGEPVTGRNKSGGGVYITSNIMGFVTAPKLNNCYFNSNNSAWNGGAVMIFNKENFTVNPYFTSCSFSSNTSNYGGAVNIYGGNDGDDLVFYGCFFEANFARNGGGMHYYNLYGSHQLVLDSCAFDVNFVEDTGGAYFQEVTNTGSTTLFVNNCRFTNNSAYEGGGIASLSFSDGSNIEIRQSEFNDNFAFDAAAITTYYDNELNVENSSFHRNIAVSYASCIFSTETSVNLFNCIFSDCQSTENSYVLYIGSNNPSDTSQIVNCVFHNNSYDSGILEMTNMYNLSIKNTIFSNNSLGLTDKLFHVPNNVPFYFDISHCLFDIPDVTYLIDVPVTVGPNMLYNLDPQFVDPDNGDFRLNPCSPAHNAGSNATVDSLGILTDIDGNPRIQGGTVDMGAYESPAFQASSATVTAMPCGPGGLGSVTLTLGDGCPPFFINWSVGSTIADSSLALLDLPTGNHSITITDGLLESDTISVTISPAPAIMGSANATDIACASGVGGTASIEAVGGTGAFSFLWSNGAMTASATNLPAGAYQVTVTDENGCTLTDSVTVGITGNLSLGLSIHPITCSGDSDGSATVQPIGGTMPFAWLWQNGETTPTLDSLSGGSYTATVTDALGCTGDIDFTITPPSAINVTITAIQPLCFGEMGTATASGTGGTGSLHFAWDNGAMTASTSLSEGTHTVTVTDGNGCTKVESLTIQAPPQLQVFLTVEPAVLCFGANNGTISVLPFGGTAPYNWSGPIENLSAGSYEITVTDSNGCTTVSETTNVEYPEITITDTVTHASGPTEADGSILLNAVLGGTGTGYQFDWSNSAVSQNLSGVPAGDYLLTITDSQGCSAVFSFTVDFESAAGETQNNPFKAAILPNPSGKNGARLQLGNAVAGLSIRIHDAQGSLVSEGKLARSEYLLPKGMAAGSYLILLDNGKQRMSLKWVVGE